MKTLPTKLHSTYVPKEFQDVTFIQKYHIDTTKLILELEFLDRFNDMFSHRKDFKLIVPYNMK